MTAVLRTFGDFGGSGTKIVFWNDLAQVFLMEPEVAEISSSRLSRLKLGGVAGGEPEDSAYVRYGDRTFAVGRLGRIQEGNSGVGLPKRDRAVVKALAQIGVVWEKMSQRNPSMSTYFPLEMGILLPLEQFWRDAEGVKAELRQAVTNFGFRETTLSAQVQKLEILPEGSGIYLSRVLQLANEGQSAKDRVIVVLMFGHWQLSILTFDRGNAPVENNSNSRGPGFIEYLQRCATEIPEMSFDSPLLFNAILEDRDEILVPGRTEPISIKEAKQFAHRLYWEKVREFLLKYLPAEDCEIVIAGGAASRIESELRSFLQERQRQTIDVYSLSDPLRSAMADSGMTASDPVSVVRLMDAYSGFRWLAASKTAAAR